MASPLCVLVFPACPLVTRYCLWGIISTRRDLQRNSALAGTSGLSLDKQVCSSCRLALSQSFILSGWLPETLEFPIQYCRQSEQYSDEATSRTCWGGRAGALVCRLDECKKNPAGSIWESSLLKTTGDVYYVRRHRPSPWKHAI